MEHLLPFLVGLGLLALGGELLVRGAVQVAERLGVSPLLIGLTLVGFGTSTPELVTSVGASVAGSPGIAVGNVVGSNIANVLVILGLAALVSPIAVSSRALARDGVLGVAVAMAVLLVGHAWMLDRLVGAAFVACLAGYILFAWRQESGGGADHTAAFERAQAFEAAHRRGLHTPPGAGPGRLLLSLGLVAAGLGAVVFGGGILVGAAIGLARDFAISEAVIGLTIVAVGTSMPELVTSLVAAIRRQGDVALGNVLGSNIYNVLGIAGATGLIAPTGIPETIVRFDAWVMLATAGLLLLLARTGWRIGRREGALLLGGYAAYVWTIWPTT